MASYRKTAIAALAVSALLLTPSVAYADHNHHSVSVTSSGSGVSMNWAYYGGDVTDYTTTGPEIFKDARASALMIGLDGRSVFRLRVTGIDAEEGTYGVHLHQGTCDANNPGPPGGAGPHYNVTWDPMTGLMGAISNETEVWLDLKVDSDGDARSTATVDFVPEGKRSIVLHASPTVTEAGQTNPVGWAGTRLACLPFNISEVG